MCSNPGGGEGWAKSCSALIFMQYFCRRPNAEMYMTGADWPGPLQENEKAPLLPPLSAARARPLGRFSSQLASLLNGIMLWGGQATSWTH